MKNFITNLLSDNGTISSNRFGFLCLVLCAIALCVVVAILSFNVKTEVVNGQIYPANVNHIQELIFLIGILLSVAFGGKVSQRYVEMKEASNHSNTSEKETK